MYRSPYNLKAKKEFDYNSLDRETLQFVQQQTVEIQAIMKRTAQGILIIGQKLIEAKEKLGHGRFLNWLEAEFEWSWDTAKRFMRVAEVFGENQQFADLELAPSALYILAAPSTPKSAREEILALAKAGGSSITYKTVNAIKLKHLQGVNESQSESNCSDRQGDSLSNQNNHLITDTPCQPIISLQTSVSQSHSNPEIIPTHRLAQVEASAETDRVTMYQTAQTPSVPLIEQISNRDNEQSFWWQLGGRHLLYCGDPNSPKFIRRVKGNPRLVLAFPPIQTWLPTLPSKTQLVTSTFLPEGKNIIQVDEVIESNILFYSRLKDTIVVCFLPSLKIMTIINRLDRRALVAEPDLRQCHALITEWKQAGLRTERIR